MNRETLARTIEVAIVEKTLHHPVKAHWERLKWLWPLVADAILDGQPVAPEQARIRDARLMGEDN